MTKKEKKEKPAPKSVEPFLGFYNAALCIHGVEGNICDECFTKYQEEEEEAEKKKEATTTEKHEYYVILTSRNTPTLPNMYVILRNTQEEALSFIRDNCFMASFRLIKVTSDSPITIEDVVVEQDPRVSRIQPLTR